MMSSNEERADVDTSLSYLSNLITDMLSPVNFGLMVMIALILYKMLSKGKTEEDVPPRAPQLPPMKRRDMTYQELKKYDGLNEEGRVCVAVNGKVFDVTKGKVFYGPGGPYAAFAGRDATRCLATFSVTEARDYYDDLSDLNSMQMDSAREWEIQFQEKYQYVGRLLKPGEEPTDYSDEDDASQDQSTLETPPSPETQSSQLSSKKDE